MPLSCIHLSCFLYQCPQIYIMVKYTFNMLWTCRILKDVYIWWCSSVFYITIFRMLHKYAASTALFLCDIIWQCKQCVTGGREASSLKYSIVVRCLISSSQKVFMFYFELEPCVFFNRKIFLKHSLFTPSEVLPILLSFSVQKWIWSTT